MPTIPKRTEEKHHNDPQASTYFVNIIGFFNNSKISSGLFKIYKIVIIYDIRGNKYRIGYFLKILYPQVVKSYPAIK